MFLVLLLRAKRTIPSFMIVPRALSPIPLPVMPGVIDQDFLADRRLIASKLSAFDVEGHTHHSPATGSRLPTYTARRRQRRDRGFQFFNFCSSGGAYKSAGGRGRQPVL